MSKKIAKPDIVTDDKGRQRFHGAFTGGFSAGYFNTVGSEEGFKPSTYVSSRGNRAERKVLKAEDFMDEEDGLAGLLKSREEYDTFGNESKNNTAKLADVASKGSVIPGAVPADLIVAPTKSIGKLLLKQMGWKEGQGIGARTIKKRNIKESIHPSINIENLSSSILEDGLVTFAAKIDIDIIKIPPPKDDFYGIGYDPAVENPEFYGLKKNSNILSKSKGVYRVDSLFDNGSKYEQNLSRYALDDEEDDIYDSGSIHMIKRELKEEVLINENDDSEKLSKVPNAINEWLSGTATVTTQICPSDGRPPLPGFVLAKVPQQIPEYYQPIEPPPDFNPYHKFTDDNNKDTKISQENAVKLATDKKSGAQGLALTRAMIISDEEVKPKNISVFDLMGPENKRKMDEMMANLKAGKSVDSIIDAKAEQKPELEPLVEAVDNRPMLINNVAATKFAGLAQAFKNRFIQSDDSVPIPSDAKKEPEISSRNDNELKDPQTATRLTTEWRPNPLLCKRFNVPVPEISKEKSSASTEQPEKSLTGTIFGQHMTEIESAIDPRAGIVADNDATAVVEDITWEIDRKPKPPMSFFKSIFEDSSEEEEEEEENEEENEENEEKKTQSDHLVVANVSINESNEEMNVIVELPSSLTVEETTPEELPKAIVFRKPSHNLNNARKDITSRIRTNNMDNSMIGDKKRHKALLSFQDDDNEDDDNDQNNDRKRSKYTSNRKTIHDSQNNNIEENNADEKELLAFPSQKQDVQPDHDTSNKLSNQDTSNRLSNQDTSNRLSNQDTSNRLSNHDTSNRLSNHDTIVDMPIESTVVLSIETHGIEKHEKKHKKKEKHKKKHEKSKKEKKEKKRKRDASSSDES